MSRGSSKQPIPQNVHNTPKSKDWDQLNELRETARQLILQPEGLRAFIGDKDLEKYLPDVSEVARLLYAIAKDSEQFALRYREIANSHAGKTGSAQNEQEYMQSLEISLQYFDLTQNFESVVLPMLAQVMEIYLDANERRAQSNQSTEGQSNNDN